jgi:hypothetical protein
MAASGWQATHWSLGVWRHFEFDRDKPDSSSKPTTARAQFDCTAWQAGQISAPPEPKGLVIRRLNAWSPKVTLTQQALDALRVAEANLAHTSRRGR